MLSRLSPGRPNRQNDSDPRCRLHSCGLAWAARVAASGEAAPGRVVGKSAAVSARVAALAMVSPEAMAAGATTGVKSAATRSARAATAATAASTGAAPVEVETDFVLAEAHSRPAETDSAPAKAQSASVER